ncbi:hypothetical protein [Allosalinactinospora lopnorensis]|uniref:hypothetical protein n=1 Tax=Allosalinactinospora lopnorensis TaxID=1352348 RepID=UPI000623EC64|nr:hypothetical protein [Allosalinactinospora lopnorensis]
MCQPSTANADTTDIYIFDPGSLSSVQCMGDACAICHAKWPRPRTPLGELPDGTRVYGCRECADIIASHMARSAEHALAAH